MVSVSSYRLNVLLDPDIRSPVRAYPERITVVTQIGGYLLFPVSPGDFVVGIIVGASEDEAIEPDANDSVTLQLTRSRRLLRLNLVGQLSEARPFKAGVSVYPTLETAALLPTEEQLKGILNFQPDDLEGGADVALPVGTSPIYPRQAVTGSYNDLLARPLAIIGNTGSGKSCSVASLLQTACALEGGKAENAKFIVLDVNGEYGAALAKLADEKEPPAEAKREVHRAYANGVDLTLPLWTFNLGELVAFFEAAQASQVPVLERIITSLREEAVDPEPARDLRRIVQLADQCIDYLGSLSAYAAEVSGRAVADNTAEAMLRLFQIAKRLDELAEGKIDVPAPIKNFKDEVGSLKLAGLKKVEEYKKLRRDKDYADFNSLPVPLVVAVEAFVDKFEPEFQRMRQDAFSKGGLKPITADSPVAFDITGLQRDALFRIATSGFRGQERIQEYVATLRLRIHRALSDKRWRVFTSAVKVEFPELLNRLYGDPTTRAVVLDCSMLAYDVLPFFCAVIGRLILDMRAHVEAGRRTAQPYALVLEEAHNYLRPYRDGESHGIRLARETFERIAKEGRKFGLSLIIASQRPSDVSATVLSQCANFIVHRIQNPEDIDYFKKILPTGSRDILDQLPILAPGDGLLIGSAVNVPARVNIRKPVPEPRSETPKPWKAWREGQELFDSTGAVASWLSQT